jgi:3-methylcrotonyl-CoA carboxylase alpha subunit
MITGLDRVEWQLRVADGEALPLRQSQVTQRGHAVEARLYAEDPERGFLPSTGRIDRLRFPAGREHVRVDTGVREGDEVSIHYDPMVAKVIAWGTDRLDAIDRLRAALEATDVDGLRTNTRFLWEILGHQPVRAGDVSTRLLESGLPPSGATGEDTRTAWLIAAAVGAQVAASQPRAGQTPGTPWGQHGGFRLNAAATVRVALSLGNERRWLRLRPAGPDVEVELDGQSHLLQGCELADGTVSGRIDGQPFEARCETGEDGFLLRRQCLRFEFAEDTGAEHHASAEHEGHVRSPMPGLVLDVRTRAGEPVEAGAVLVVLEAMKMEHSLCAPWAGTVMQVAVGPGDRVEEGVELVVLEPVTDSALRQPADPK